MTIVNHDTGEIVETIGVNEARRITTEAQNEFRSGAAHTARGWELVEQAVLGGGHVDLGYRSPGDYLAAEFDGILSGFNITERRLAVRTMTSWGLSTRAIAPVLGVGNKTVHRDIEAGVSGDTPEGRPDPAPEVVDADLIDDEPEAHDLDEDNDPEPEPEPSPRPVTGIDGKTYKRPGPKAPSRATPRRALPDQFFDAAYDAAKKVESLHRLTGDDRFPQNAKKIAAKHRNDLLRTHDLLQQVINSLPETEATK